MAVMYDYNIFYFRHQEVYSPSYTDEDVTAYRAYYTALTTNA